MEFRFQADEYLYNQLIACGLREYDAKIYVALFGMGVASATELHESTGIPRGRVYETLSYLQEKQFINSEGTSPIMYRVEDIRLTYSAFQNDLNTKTRMLYLSLLKLEDLHHPMKFPQDSVPILTEGGIENQFRLMCRRAKSEIVILCNDAELLKRFSADLHKIRKKVDVEVIVPEPEMATELSLPCYMVKDAVDKSLFNPMGTDYPDSMLLQIYTDMRNMFIICNKDGRMNGFYMQNPLHEEYIIKTLHQNITRIKYL
ncbi:TrmB family transcriptional regulator [Methanogenium organophilum]|uniref:Transcription regulator TrmB N-terminal domain-containing protein n=1 Tax=Methanogenium organophilum TaxID=2199 RepID=A0A9X9S3T0_METOG|nr:helix-turn-helix domain-containing protein [Methanogenium organophilum]WAI01424.1 hypothetical protein OU421_00690 [Methanogenium organophilum]